MQEKLDQLVENGYCVFNQVLPADLLNRLRTASDQVLDANDYQNNPTNQGNLVGMSYQIPAFLDLITWDGAQQALGQLGFDHPRYWSGFVIAKQPGEPPLYWHQDWVFWDEPETIDPMPHQLFFMYYLTDTCVENGCLRLIPQSHIRRFDIHDLLGQGHDSDVRLTTDHDQPLFLHHPSAVDVQVKAGDLVVGDARLLHSANPNRADHRRTVLTLWYLPRFEQASARVQAGYCQRMARLNDNLDPTDRARLQPLIPTCPDDVEPAIWNRVPSDLLH